MLVHQYRVLLREESNHIPFPEQKSSSNTTAVPLSVWLLGSKPALVTRLLTLHSTNLQAWLNQKETLENSQTSARACSFLNNVWGNLKGLENWLHKSQQQVVSKSKHGSVLIAIPLPVLTPLKLKKVSNLEPLIKLRWIFLVGW